MTDTRETYKTMDLALRVGELLLSSGAGAADARAQMDNVAHGCGLRWFNSDVTFTELSMSHQPDPQEPALLQMRVVRHRATDYGQLTQVDHLVRDLVAGGIDRDQAATRLNQIVSSGHSRPRWSVTLATGVMGAGVGLVLNGHVLMLLIAFVAAVGVDRIQFFLTKRRIPTFYVQVVGGLFATLVAVAVAALGLQLSAGRVITSSIIMLLAGVSFLGAIQDALTGFPLTAGARILEAILATAGLLAGVSGGLTTARVIGVDLGTPDTGLVRYADLPLMATGAAVTAAAYAFAYYAPHRSLLPIALIGGGAMAIYFVVLDAGFGLTWASAVAALTIGLVSFSVSGRVRVPALVVVTAAMVPLLPGLAIYRGLLLMGEGGTEGLLSLFNAASIAIALSSGVILGEYVAQPLKREARRLELQLAGPRLVGPHTVRAVRRRKRPRNAQSKSPGKSQGKSQGPSAGQAHPPNSAT